MAERGGSAADRWDGRPALATAVSVAALLAPALAAMAAGLVVSHALGRPHGGPAVLRWWYLELAVPLVVFVGADRAGRRTLPLAALLRMTLVFPDRAPARLAVARRAASTRQLARAAAAAPAGAVDDRTEAAVKILLLVTELNAHDRLTRGHSERVRAYTDLLSDELHLPGADRDRLRWAALLHDIGKIQIPATLLNKAARPEPGEWALIQQHPTVGAGLAAPLAEWLGPWYQAIPEHHERWDGTGYPRGLRGEEISYAGRIVAVADSYEAMTAARSYKRPMTHEAARQELARCAGTHFDPVLVRAFLGASIGRARLLAGPLALLGQIPALNQLPRLGQLASASSTAAVGVAAAAVVAVGAAQHLAPPASPGRLVSQPIATAPAPPRSPGATTSTTSPPAHGAATSPTPPTTGPATTASSSTTVVTSTSVTTPTTVGTTTTVGRPATATTGTAATVPASTTVPVTTTVPGTTTVPVTTVPVTTAPATVPAAPAALVATPDVGQVALSWQAPADGGAPLTGYRLQVSPGGATAAIPAGQATYTATGLLPGTAYTFALSATNAVGAGPAATAAVTTPDVPSSPGAVTATPGDGTATISWAAPANDGGSPVELYVVTTSSGPSSTTSYVSAPATSTVLTGLTDGTTYEVTVEAVNGVGNSAATSPQPVRPVGLPTAPVVSEVVAGTASVTVDWSAPGSDGGDPVTGYTATLLQGSTTLQVQSVGAGVGTTTFTTVPTGVQLRVEVRATTAAGTGAAGVGGPVVAAAIPDPTPGTPTAVQATAGPEQVTLSWTDPAATAGVDEVVVTPSTGGVAQAPVTFAAGPSTTTETVTGLTDGVAYSFTVALANPSGQGLASAPSTAATPVGTPTTPGSVTAAGGDGEAVVSWAASSGGPVTGYLVTPLVGATAHPELAQAVAATTTAVVVPGLTNGTTYRFAVQAQAATAPSAAGTSGPVTPAQQPGPLPPPPHAPTVATGEVDHSLVASWSAPALPADAPPVVSWTVVATADHQPTVTVLVPAGTTIATLTGLTDGVAYKVTVAGVNGAGPGPASGDSQPATPGLAPGAPTGLAVTSPSPGHWTASWSAPPAGSEATSGYTVTLVAGTADPHTWQADANHLSQDLGGIPAGTACTVTVSAIDASGTGPAATTSFSS